YAADQGPRRTGVPRAVVRSDGGVFLVSVLWLPALLTFVGLVLLTAGRLDVRTTGPVIGPAEAGAVAGRPERFGAPGVRRPRPSALGRRGIGAGRHARALRAPQRRSRDRGDRRRRPRRPECGIASPAGVAAAWSRCSARQGGRARSRHRGFSRST